MLQIWCWVYINVVVYSLKTETPEEDRENRRRRSPPRTRSDFSDPRFAPDMYIFLHVERGSTRYKIKIYCLFRNILLNSACNRNLNSVYFPPYRGREDRRRDERKRRDLDRHGKSLSDSHRERERHERRRGSPRGRTRSQSRSRSGSRGKSRDRRGEKAAR